MAQISIIIPVYNSASFLEACVYSLLQQSFGDFEIRLVDDGSTDGSGALCDRLAGEDARVKVLHTSNHGAAHARQLGLEQATGDYLCFVDSDDTMPVDGLQRLVAKATAHPASDIIVGFCRKSSRWWKSELSVHTYRNLLIEGRYNIGTLWGKLFKRTLFSQGIPTLPNWLVMGEDLLINLFLACRTSEQVQLVLGDPIYDYIQRDTGISRGFTLTADYEYNFHHERLRMIPDQLHSAYQRVMIHRRLRMLRRLAREAKRNHTLSELQASPFVAQLTTDIQSEHYSFWSYPRVSVWNLIKKKYR